MSTAPARKSGFYDNPRFEKIGGKFYAMAAASVNHSRVSDNITHMFKLYLKGRWCKSFSVVNVFLEDDNVIPDNMIVCDKDKIKPNGIHGAPDLVVEILSPSTARFDRDRKMKIYERGGVREYWLADPANKSIDVYVLENDHFVLSGMYAFEPDDGMSDYIPEEYRKKTEDVFTSRIFPDMEVRLEEVFEDVT